MLPNAQHFKAVAAEMRLAKFLPYFKKLAFNAIVKVHIEVLYHIGNLPIHVITSILLCFPISEYWNQLSIIIVCANVDEVIDL